MNDILENKSKETGLQLQVKSNDTQYCYLRFLNATLFITFASLFYTYAKLYKYLQNIYIKYFITKLFTFLKRNMHYCS